MPVSFFSCFNSFIFLRERGAAVTLVLYLYTVDEESHALGPRREAKVLLEDTRLDVHLVCPLDALKETVGQHQSQRDTSLPGKKQKRWLVVCLYMPRIQVGSVYRDRFSANAIHRLTT